MGGFASGGVVLGPKECAGPVEPPVVALTLSAHVTRARRGALLGLVAGLACFVPLLAWSGVYVGALPWLALAVSQAAFVALIGAALPTAWRVPGGAPGTVFAVTGLWVLQELLRARLPFGGFPWGRLAFSQAHGPFLGRAALAGAPAVTPAGAPPPPAAAARAGGAPRPALVVWRENPSDTDPLRNAAATAEIDQAAA